LLYFPRAMPKRSKAKTTPASNDSAGDLHHSRTLATLRDTLLPKLLSGELSMAAASS
jgi:hypothetical protein